ncbi:MAG: hypothetical protein H7249_01010 [Chitinophagaceae bacterium]|nr:hypothetical protein [Oligoflexus sp.]
MKLNHLPLALLLSSSAYAQPYELRKIPLRDIDHQMAIGSDVTGTPKNLQGLWWMDGNPMADEVMSFASTEWTDILKDGEVVGHTASIPVYDQGVWSWHDSFAGRCMYEWALGAHLRYNLSFNEDFTDGHVTPEIKPFAMRHGMKPSGHFVEFTMVKVPANEYRRDSTIGGRTRTYRLRRIVDGEGNRLPSFVDYLRGAEVEELLLPFCKEDSNSSLPSACVKK